VNKYKIKLPLLSPQMSTGACGEDRYRVLVERVRAVEGDNSALVLENEQQRGQYEKCLDEIANQVIYSELSIVQVNVVFVRTIKHFVISCGTRNV